MRFALSIGSATSLGPWGQTASTKVNNFHDMNQRSQPGSRLLPRGWYSISAAAGRRWLSLLGLGLLALLGYLGYQHWLSKGLERRALGSIQEANRLLRNLQQRSDFTNLRQRYGNAWDLRDRAKGEYDRGEMRLALDHANASLLTLDTILDTGRKGSKGSIRFMGIEGDVQFRRGERGPWEKARANISLGSGDWVKTTGGGKAELMFSDGNAFTLGPKTLVHLPRAGSDAEEGVADIVTGWVELDTGNAASRVNTPQAEARIGKNSEALVSYDEDRSRARFASFAGNLEVRSKNGEERSLGKLQMVTQSGDSLSPLKPLPAAPLLLAPEDGTRVDRLDTGRLQLSWQRVQRAQRYALQVSTSRLFAQNIIDSTNRSLTRATLGLRGEGSFYWQIAAVNRDGILGPWSAIGSFQIIAKRGGDSDDRTPPELEIHSVEPYGSQVIVNGKAEPGSRVSINDETVSIQADGSFQKAVPIGGGKQIVNIVATDSWGNEAKVEHEVFIEVF